MFIFRRAFLVLSEAAASAGAVSPTALAQNNLNPGSTLYWSPVRSLSPCGQLYSSSLRM